MSSTSDQRDDQTTGLQLKGARVIVVGASGVIGRATSILLGAHGARLVLTANTNVRELRRFAADMFPADAAHVVKCDVRSEESAAFVTQQVASEFGRIDSIAYCAGYRRRRKQIDLRSNDLSDAAELFSIHCVGFFRLCRHLLPLMCLPASAVALSSVIAVRGTIPGSAAYAAACAALEAAVRVSARDFLASGLRINVLSPGLVLPPDDWRRWNDSHAIEPQYLYVRDAVLRTAAQEPLRPVDVARFILQLISPHSGRTAGEIVRLDGGIFQ